jgi:hypothetical protein
MTVVSRTIVAIPERSAEDVWNRIVELIAPNRDSVARTELARVAGVACSCITDEALADDALVVHGTGPRLRIYAVYGDDAVEGDRKNESPLSWVPTEGDWRMSIPCLAGDLSWIQAMLAQTSKRVTARELGAPVDGDEDADNRSASMPREPGLAVDLNAFFRQ